MDVVILILSVVLGSFIFSLINKAFTVFYFGFKGMASTWGVCVFISLIVLTGISEWLRLA